jgi:hypothetical protein
MDGGESAAFVPQAGGEQALRVRGFSLWLGHEDTADLPQGRGGRKGSQRRKSPGARGHSAISGILCASLRPLRFCGFAVDVIRF